MPYFHYDDRRERTMPQTTQNTQGPMTAMQHLSRLRFGSQGPHGDELCEQIADKMGVNDTFGDEIHEKFSSLMTLIHQLKDNPNQDFKSRYWSISPETIDAAIAVEDYVKNNPEDTSSVRRLESAVLLCVESQDDKLGIAISNELQGSKNQSFWKDLIEAVSEKVSLGPDAP